MNALMARKHCACLQWQPAMSHGPKWNSRLPKSKTNLTFVGLLGMIDPPRPEVAAAIQTAREAGIQTVMITGDYPDTAQAIARSDAGLDGR